MTIISYLDFPKIENKHKLIRSNRATKTIEPFKTAFQTILMILLIYQTILMILLKYHFWFHKYISLLTYLLNNSIMESSVNPPYIRNFCKLHKWLFSYFPNVTEVSTAGLSSFSMINYNIYVTDNCQLGC